MGMGRLSTGCLVLCLAVITSVCCQTAAAFIMSESYADDDDYDGNAGDDEGISDSLCDLQNCLELYQAAQESLQPRDEDSRSRPRHRNMQAGRSPRPNCQALRTFYLCIQNMSRSCLGNLYFHSSHRVAEKQMKSLNCSVDGPIFRPPVAIPSPGGQFPESVVPSSECLYKGPKDHQYCSVFGDPHLWTFDGTRHTCQMNGAWPLVDNVYLSVQVTSEVLSGGGSAPSKVTVVVKRYRDCVTSRYVTYQAVSTEPLPATFDEGMSSYGDAETVRVSRIVAGRHVEIVLQHIDTLVVLRKYGRHFSVAVLTPTQVATAFSGSLDVQLCTTHCPVAQRLSLKQIVSPSSANIERAAEVCRQNGLVDFFLDTCVFDFVATGGDRNFTLASVHALHDYRRLTSDSMRLLHNRTTVHDTSSAPHRFTPRSAMTMFLLYLVITLLSADSCRQTRLWHWQLYNVVYLFILDCCL